MTLVPLGTLVTIAHRSFVQKTDWSLPKLTSGETTGIVVGYNTGRVIVMTADGAYFVLAKYLTVLEGI